MVASFSAISSFKSESGNFSNTSSPFSISSSACFKTSSRLSRLNRGFASTVFRINCPKKPVVKLLDILNENYLPQEEQV
ncbi:hypothetical protein DERF_000398 [Dermatophagoides farinae]|uniref:Uncharacterized protein n=1 Tax=Dermatophagoides farinae TaxID=6954 RepID=A0A922LCF6_DERFA|nr:hypothetical protein DERF_000398 [Dermatophagoides farinae]